MIDEYHIWQEISEYTCIIEYDKRTPCHITGKLCINPNCPYVKEIDKMVKEFNDKLMILKRKIIKDSNRITIKVCECGKKIPDFSDICLSCGKSKYKFTKNRR